MLIVHFLPWLGQFSLRSIYCNHLNFKPNIKYICFRIFSTPHYINSWIHSARITSCTEIIIANWQSFIKILTVIDWMSRFSSWTLFLPCSYLIVPGLLHNLENLENLKTLGNLMFDWKIREKSGNFSILSKILEKSGNLRVLMLEVISFQL